MPSILSRQPLRLLLLSHALGLRRRVRLGELHLEQLLPLSSSAAAARRLFLLPL